MKTLKKWIAFMLAAGLIVTAAKITAMTALAAATIEGSGPPTSDVVGNDDTWYRDKNTGNMYFWGGGKWNWSESMNGGPEPGSSSSSEGVISAEEQDEAQKTQQAAYDEGFDNIGDMYRAAEKSMSAGEYYNNVVTSTPGIENAVTVGQGGNLVVNGEVTNMTASISKVTNRAYVDSIRVNQPEGRLLNVVDVSYPAVEATINFYMPSVTAEMDVTALQYNAGTWVNVDVAEVREDHVVLDLKGNGVVAFIAK